MRSLPFCICKLEAINYWWKPDSLAFFWRPPPLQYACCKQSINEGLRLWLLKAYCRSPPTPTMSSNHTHSHNEFKPHPLSCLPSTLTTTVLCTVPSMLLATHVYVPRSELCTLAIERLPLDNSCMPSVVAVSSGWVLWDHWKERAGSGRRTEQGRMAGEPATTVRDMEALRRMGGAGVGGREKFSVGMMMHWSAILNHIQVIESTWLTCRCKSHGITYGQEHIRTE